MDEVDEILYLVSLQVIGFSDLVDLWIIKIKKPMILCARIISRSREQSMKRRSRSKNMWEVCLFYSHNNKIAWLSNVADTFLEKFTRCAKVCGLIFLTVLFGCWMAEQVKSRDWREWQSFVFYRRQHTSDGILSHRDRTTLQGNLGKPEEDEQNNILLTGGNSPYFPTPHYHKVSARRLWPSQSAAAVTRALNCWAIFRNMAKNKTKKTKIEVFPFCM